MVYSSKGFCLSQGTGEEFLEDDEPDINPVLFYRVFLFCFEGNSHRKESDQGIYLYFLNLNSIWGVVQHYSSFPHPL